jgi:hypothetical protein
MKKAGIMKIMRKGIAVDTVVLIILGIIVLGLVGYLIFTHYGIGQNVIVSKECLAARMDYCMTGGSYADLQKDCPTSPYADTKSMTDEQLAQLTSEQKPCEGLP